MNSNDNKLTAVLAVRNTGSRLFGKPLQNIDINERITILDLIINTLRQQECIHSIVLAISEGVENLCFVDIAKKKNLEYIVGSENDVLSRLISGAHKVNARNVLRITSESPFPYLKPLEECFNIFESEKLDALFYDNIIDGCGFEIVSTKAFEEAHARGDSRHRSELCTLYIRENIKDFNVKKISPEQKFQRFDLRLTVDYPEDLMVCRKLYSVFKDKVHLFPLEEMIEYLDSEKKLKELVFPFTEQGYKKMYL